MNTPEQSQLGKASAYVDQYDASLLFPIPRAAKRAENWISQSCSGALVGKTCSGGGSSDVLRILKTVAV